MHVIAVSTPFTRESLHQAALLPAAYIVDDPAVLPATVKQLVSEHKKA